MRRTAAVAAGLLAVALVLGARGCATPGAGAPGDAAPGADAPGAAAPGAGGAPPGEVSLAYARQVLSAFLTTDDVARAAGAESLELSLVS